jgi:hypothetical protein
MTLWVYASPRVLNLPLSADRRMNSASDPRIMQHIVGSSGEGNQAKSAVLSECKLSGFDTGEQVLDCRWVTILGEI